MQSKQLFSGLKNRLAERLNHHNYDSWIEPVAYVSTRDSRMTVAVPSLFFVEWITEHYKDMIEEILQDLSGKKHNLNITVATLSKTKETGHKKSRTSADQEKPDLKAVLKKANLNEKYDLKSFIVGKSNEFCHASCSAIVKKPGTTYNPLFIYGGVGLGKTHLMQAIGNEILKKDKSLKVLYISSEKFVNDLIGAIQRGAMSGFRKKYRELDVLLVDDIQFIGGKERTQEEFFHTFNSLFQEKKQIVLSSDKFPKDITNMEDRLRSRFAWGLISDIAPPELEVKIAIVNKIAKENGFELSDDVRSYLARLVKSNIRELEGCLARVMAYASLTGREINLEMATSTLKGIYDDTARTIEIKQIQKVVADFYKIKVSDLKSKSRKKSITIPRHVAVYICREYTNFSLPEIGRSFGGRDHTTVMHSVARIKEQINSNTQIYNEISAIKKSLDL